MEGKLDYIILKRFIENSIVKMYLHKEFPLSEEFDIKA